MTTKEQLLEQLIEIHTLLGVLIASASEKEESYNKPQNLVCPECGGEMVSRTNRQDGNKFWGCKKYPNCRGTRDSEGMSKAEREEQKYKQEQVNQESGFSFNRNKRSPATEVSPPSVDTGWVNPFAKK
jgi:ssDNA-binding Zn-finger/Zn-ribbon topoisomerase 1